MYDVIIRGGSIIDGLGGAARSGDVAVKDGRIAEIGKISSSARQTIDADGAIVTPGFIDVHSHYDGQVMWDDKIDPGFSHGTTTTIAGNCGVGFAPVHKEHTRELMDFMTGVEDIPGIVLEEGLDWKWSSFAEYFDRIAARSYTMDVASNVPHGPIRLHVMGDRALRHEAATSDDIIAMADLVRGAMAAGAAGFSTGRIVEHRSSNGNNVPGTFALEDEVLALARAMGEGRNGVFQVAPRGQVGSLFLPEGASARETRLAEHRLLETIAQVSGRPVTYGLLEVGSDVEDAGIMIAESDRAIARGIGVYPQISPRGAGLMYMLEGYHIFQMRPSYREIAHLPLQARVEAMREPARRAAILREADVEGEFVNDKMALTLLRYIISQNPNSFILNSPVDFEPGPEQRLEALAATAGKTPEEYLYDHYASGSGTNFNVNLVANYVFGNLETTRGFLMNPNVISGLADGGAHSRVICDAAMPTFQLAYWSRQRTRGQRVPLEFMINKLTGAAARLYGLKDRGSLEVGKRADINVIDYERLTLKTPRMVYDMPSGAGRILQDSEGYLATLVAGIVTRRNDEDTGARPGRLLRFGDRLS